MIKSLQFIILAFILSVCCLQADPYYFELISQRKNHTSFGLRNTHTMYVLGTIHDLPFDQLPLVVQNHIHEQQRKDSFFLGEIAIGTSKNHQVTQADIGDWYSCGYFRKPGEGNCLRLLDPQQKQQLLKYIGIVYPEL